MHTLVITPQLAGFFVMVKNILKVNLHDFQKSLEPHINLMEMTQQLNLEFLIFAQESLLVFSPGEPYVLPLV